jgi:hypothetical protein
MGRSEHPANGRSEAVHNPQPGVGQRQAAAQTGQRHVFAGREIPGLVASATQRASDPRNAVAAERIGQWIGPARNERFDELRQRIESRARGERGRKTEREFRIHHRQLRQHERAAQADFHAMLRRCEHGIARDFRPAASGCRNGDEGS